MASNDETVAKQAAASLEKSRQPDAQKEQQKEFDFRKVDAKPDEFTRADLIDEGIVKGDGGIKFKQVMKQQFFALAMGCVNLDLHLLKWNK